MRLAASEIKKEIDRGTLKFDPPVEELRIDASSVDLCLSENLFIIGEAFESQEKAGVTSILNLRDYTWSKFQKEFGRKADVSLGYLDIPINTLVIGMTREKVTLPQHLGGRVEGKSSTARIGLFVHISSPTIHPGFNNNITLEFLNVGPIPIRVFPGDPICQLILEKVEGTGLYAGQFQQP